jgi:hypothetical protein
LLPVLQPAMACIVTIQSRDSLLSGALFGILKLKARLRQLLDDECAAYAKDLLRWVDHYFCGIDAPSSAYVITAALDPRFKRLNFLSADGRIETWRYITEDCKLMHEHSGTANKNTEPSSVPHSQEEQILLELLGPMDGPATTTSTCLIQQEISIFRDFSAQDLQVNPPDVWRTNLEYQRLPLLKRYAAKWFCIQPTEAENERDFSLTGSGPINRIS